MGKIGPEQPVRRHDNGLRSSLYSNSLYLMFDSGVTATLGFIFWVIAARLYPVEDVGLGSALISATVLLASIGTLGVEYGLIRFLSGDQEKRGALINSSMTLAAIATALVCGIFLAGIPLWSPAFLILRSNPIFIAAFIGSAIAWTFYAITTSVFIGFRRAEFTLIKNIAYNLLRLACVAILAQSLGVLGIFAAWGTSVAVASVISTFLFIPRLLPGYYPRAELHRHMTNKILRFSFVNYISNGLWALPGWVLPIIVVNILGTTDNAHFYIAMGVAGLLFAIPVATSISLFAEGSYQMENIGRDLTRSLKFTLAILIPAMIVVTVAGDKVLLLFGKEYSESGGRLLWLLAPSALPMSINLLYIGVARVLKRLKNLVLTTAFVATGTLVLSFFLMPPLGVLGIAVAWLTAQTLVALVLLPSLIRIMRKSN